jgi:hypothetical protein
MTKLSIDDNATGNNDQPVYFSGVQFYLLYVAYVGILSPDSHDISY